MVKRVDTACYLLIQSVVEGTYVGGATEYLDIAKGGVSLTDFSVIKEALGDKFPADIPEKIAELEQKIISVKSSWRITKASAPRSNQALRTARAAPLCGARGP
jgi:basic membrane lipoprotein Med (substrate-binding protein (PBP1-ABC) superfamily)